MSFEGLSVRSLLKRGVVGQVTTDTPVVLRIRQVGGAAVTSVTTTTGTNIVLIDADGTTTSTFATDTTIGAVCDTINAADNWECKVLDGLRQDASVSVLVDGAISASVTDGVSYYDALSDTSASLEFTYRLTYDRSVGEDRPKGAHRVSLKEIQYLIDVGTAAMDNYQIFECDDSGNTETQIWKGLNVDNSATTDNWASGRAVITAKEGNDLVVRIKDAATLADDSGNYLTIVGERE